MTEKLLSPLRTRSWPERWLTRLAGAALSAAVYVLCLPRDRSLGLGFWESIEDVASFTISGIVVRRFRAVAGLINVMPWRILYSIPHCPVARLVPEGTESLGRLVSWYG
jgi:hypothetical protein